tara:strand:+ start:827 stop:1723 length:897 start_codon:yes stop_codon:yes gene_type:complete
MPTDSSTVIFTEYLKDQIPAKVELVLDNHQLPDYYFSKLNTPVCEDSLCYLVKIDLYWDVLGNFMDYKTATDTALTKFDHLKFTLEDHQKLKKILGNNASVLLDYQAENLLDPVLKKKSEAVADAVAGATNTSIKDEVVEGALFSTYTLWHIVNGPISQKIKAYTEAKYSTKMLQKMLFSENEHYQYYALQKIPQKELPQYTQELIRLVAHGAGDVPYFAIEKIPDRTWSHPEYQLQLIKQIQQVPFQMQNEILNNLQNIKLSEESIEALEKLKGTLRTNQQQKIATIISNSQTLLSQ